jgi:hypothetical protein
MRRVTRCVSRCVIATVVMLAACKGGGGGSGGGGGGGGAAAGKERGPCYGNGTCDKGLVCLSDLCVAPPAADCAAVADHLGGILLGNYAPKEERAVFVRDTAADCASAKLTKEAGDCLLRAESRQAIGQCEQPLGVGDCKLIVAKLQSLLPKSGPDPWLVTAADRLISRCKNEVPSRRLQACVLSATAIDQVEKCEW